MKIAKVRPVKTPERGTSLSAGIDFFVPQDFKPTWLYPNTDLLIPSGIKADVVDGCMLMAANKSGVVSSGTAQRRAGIKPKSTTLNSIVILGACIVDEDYQGEMFIHLINVGREPVLIEPDKKIAQFIIVPVSYEGIEVVEIDKLFSGPSERGEGAFSSTNK